MRTERREELRGIMRRAHVLARQMAGHYQARLAAGLRQAWAEAKRPVKGLNLARECKLTDDGLVTTEAHGAWSKGWLAKVELAAPGARFDLEREFVQADLSTVNRKGNGIKKYRLDRLVDGVYEADSVWRSYQSHRTYFLVVAGSVECIFDDKLAAKNYLAATSKKSA